MKLSDYQKIINEIYYDPMPIFPKYSENNELNDKLYEILLHDPILTINFQPEAIISLISIGEILQYNDTFVNLTTKRVNSIVSSNGMITISELSLIFPLEQLQNEEISLKESILTISPQSIFIESLIYPSCITNEICYLINSSLSSTKLTGEYYSIDFYLSQKLSDQTFSNLLLTNSQLQIYVNPCNLIISTEYGIQISSSNYIYFDANFSSINSDVIHI